MVEEGKKKEIAVIGDRDFTLGFKLAGVRETFEPENYGEKIEKLIERDDFAIVVAKEEDVKQLPGRKRNRVEESVDPVVVELSKTAESSNLQEKIRKVIGADIS